MMGWAAGLMLDNALVLGVVLILVIAVYLVRQGKIPGSGK